MIETLKQNPVIVKVVIDIFMEECVNKCILDLKSERKKICVKCDSLYIVKKKMVGFITVDPKTIVENVRFVTQKIVILLEVVFLHLQIWTIF